jgi:hypothetical protein
VNSELEQLQYEDALVSFNSVCEQYGARQTLVNFRGNYPEMFKELHVQINRIDGQPKIMALCKP